MCSWPLGGAGKGYKSFRKMDRITKDLMSTLADSDTVRIQETAWRAPLITLVCDSATASGHISILRVQSSAIIPLGNPVVPLENKRNAS